MNRNQTARASKPVMGLWVGNIFSSNIFKKKKKQNKTKNKKLVIYLLVIAGSPNCQPRLLTNLTPFLCCKQLTIAKSWYWLEGSLTLVVFFVVKRERERESGGKKNMSLWQGASEFWYLFWGRTPKLWEVGVLDLKTKYIYYIYIYILNISFISNCLT